jgi:hypothetical protein
MMRIGLMAALSVLVVAGCPAAHAQPVEAALDQPFILQGGQQVTITGEDLDVRFTQVLEDSRCPELVECFWTGQARIVLAAETDGREPTPVEFNTNPAPGLNIQTVRVSEFTITLDSLDPYPQTPEDLFALEDYRATLTVRND